MELNEFAVLIFIMGYLPVFFIGGYFKTPVVERTVIIRCKEDPKWCDAKYTIIKSDNFKK